LNRTLVVSNDIAARLGTFAHGRRTGIAAVMAIVLGASGTWAALDLVGRRTVPDPKLAIPTRDAVELAAPAIIDPTPPAARLDVPTEVENSAVRDTPITAQPAPPSTEIAGAVEAPSIANPSVQDALPTSARQKNDDTANKPNKPTPTPTAADEPAAEPRPHARVAQERSTEQWDSPPGRVVAHPSPSFGDVDLTGEFDRTAAMQVLREAGDHARSCLVGVAPAEGIRVAVTFARTGSVSNIVVEGPFAGTPKGECMAAKFRPLRVPPFRGSSVTVRKTIVF